jgi:type IV secretion system protein VirB6
MNPTTQTTALVQPIGSFLVFFDSKIMSGMDAALTGLTQYVGRPIATCAALWFLWQGIRVANGDNAPLQNLVPSVIKIAAIVALSANLANFNYWVRSLFYSGIPIALGNAVSGTNDPTGVQGVGGSFDQIWDLMWVDVGQVFAKAGTFDVGSKLAAMLCGLGVAIDLVVMAAVYIMARFLLAIVIVFGPVMIGTLLFETTKPIFERWIGKMVALIALQVAVVITLTMILNQNVSFMMQISQSSGSSSVVSDIENLAAMVVWFAMGAFAMYALPAIAYSIGSGVAVNTLGQMIGAAATAKYLLGGIGGGNSVAAGSSGKPSSTPGTEPSSASSYGLSMARPEVATSGIFGELPAPPPPPLNEATPRSA